MMQLFIQMVDMVPQQENISLRKFLSKEKIIFLIFIIFKFDTKMNILNILNISFYLKNTSDDIDKL